MRFLIHEYTKQPPCKGAFRAPYVLVDIRTVGDPKDVPHYKGSTNWWYSEGRNHRIINGQIARDLDRECWQVELTSMLELANLANIEHFNISKSLSGFEISFGGE
jgi:hypothetical protein